MKKVEFLRLKNLSENQGPLGITYDEAVNMGNFYKQATLEKLLARMKSAGIPEEYRTFILTMTNFHYGSVEADDFLQAVYAYPLNHELPEEVI